MTVTFSSLDCVVFTFMIASQLLFWLELNLFCFDSNKLVLAGILVCNYDDFWSTWVQHSNAEPRRQFQTQHHCKIEDSCQKKNATCNHNLNTMLPLTVTLIMIFIIISNSRQCQIFFIPSALRGEGYIFQVLHAGQVLTPFYNIMPFYFVLLS